MPGSEPKISDWPSNGNRPAMKVCALHTISTHDAAGLPWATMRSASTNARGESWSPPNADGATRRVSPAR